MAIKKYEKGDEEKILELDRVELPSLWNKRTVENWHWKFTNQNPNGTAFIRMIKRENKTIAHLAAIPYRLKILDTEVFASHTIGALVDKKYQNKGLLKFVGDKLFEDQIEAGICVTWGFPNERAYKFEKNALGYKDLINFDEWKIKEDLFDNNSLQIKLQPVVRFTDEFDDLWENCKNDYPIAVIRKKEYLNWRYLERPDVPYYPFALYEQNRLKGYIVLKLYKEDKILRGHIIDIFTKKNNKNILDKLIKGSFEFFKKNKVNEITVWFTGNDLIAEIFQEIGFNKININRPLILKKNKDFDFSDKIYDNSLWYFTMGDSTEIF